MGLLHKEAKSLGRTSVDKLIETFNADRFMTCNGQIDAGSVRICALIDADHSVCAMRGPGHTIRTRTAILVRRTSGNPKANLWGLLLGTERY